MQTPSKREGRYGPTFINSEAGSVKLAITYQFIQIINITESDNGRYPQKGTGGLVKAL